VRKKRSEGMMRPLAVLGLLALSPRRVRSLDDGLALTPPMGWNSDNYFHDDFPNFCLCDGVVAPKIRPPWLNKFCYCGCEQCPRTKPNHPRLTEQAIMSMADAMADSGMAAAGYNYINL
jgi:hypothetical protein